MKRIYYEHVWDFSIRNGPSFALYESWRFPNQSFINDDTQNAVQSRIA